MKPKSTEIQIRFGQRIRKLRGAKGFSQEALAAAAGIHWTYLGGMERGERNPTLKNIVKIAKALGISLCQLFDYEVDDEKETAKQRSI